MQIDARDWVFEVSEDPTAGTPVWAQIKGRESFDLNPSEGEATVDTTTAESGGVEESQPMQRGASITLTGKIDRTAGVQDAGQLAADNLAALTGEDAIGGLRFRHVEDTDWTVWSCWVTKANVGGGVNDKTTWGATFKRTGPATVEAVS